MERDHLQDLTTDGRIALKCILKIYDGREAVSELFSYLVS
jgi:hypothetical protein